MLRIENKKRMRLIEVTEVNFKSKIRQLISPVSRYLSNLSQSTASFSSSSRIPSPRLRACLWWSCSSICRSESTEYRKFERAADRRFSRAMRHTSRWSTLPFSAQTIWPIFWPHIANRGWTLLYRVGFGSRGTCPCWLRLDKRWSRGFKLQLKKMLR